MAVTGAGVETVRIDRIAAGGRGVARLADGRVSFVPLSTPGDVLDVEVVRDRGRWTEARSVRIVERGPGRREPPCPLYARCGGCALQHLEYADQLRAKAAIVADALGRLGSWEVEPPPVTPAPAEWRYRNRMTFTVRRLRGGRVVGGLHQRDRPGRILDVDERCLLPDPAIALAWGQVRSAWGGGARRLPPGRELRCTLRLAGPGAVALVVEGGRPGGDAAALLADAPALEQVWHRQRGAERPTLLAARPAERDPVAGEVAAGGFAGGNAFTQVNEAAAGLLLDHVLAVVDARPGSRVVDAYCGLGTLAGRIADVGAEVVGLERDPAAVDRGRALAPGVDFRCGDVEESLAGALPADVLVLNPPRAGLSTLVVEALLADAPPRVVYVSCDPATLARDVDRLSSTYRGASVSCFDLFPQTAHVETVVELCATT
ncbi:MAG: hypothetical protein ABFS34_08420 [Gemmatimonadota bacterium]